MKKVFFLAALCTLLISCGGTDPTVVNDTIVKNSELTSKTIENFIDAIDGDKYDQATALIDSLGVQCMKGKEIVGKLEVSKSGEEFKNSAINYMVVVESDFIPALKKAVELCKSENVDDQNKGVDMVNDNIEKLQKDYDKISEAQKAFAKENNIILY